MPSGETASSASSGPAAAHFTQQGRVALSGEGPVLTEHRACEEERVSQGHQGTDKMVLDMYTGLLPRV